MKPIFKLLFFVSYILHSLLLFSQVNEHFDDGDFICNPTWIGDTAQFEISSSKQLHLCSQGVGVSYLTTKNDCLQNTEWYFYCKQSFNSSANNFSRIYLVSNQQDLKLSLQGYFIQIGGSDDSVSLYRQHGDTVIKIISGIHFFAGRSTNEFFYKITRDKKGLWQMFVDTLGDGEFIRDASVVDSTFKQTFFFGVSCKYTSSNSTKFYFDDFYIGPIIVDTVPPFISNVRIIDDKNLDILFSEAVEKESSEYVENYIIQGLGAPIVAVRDEVNHLLVHLLFASSFKSETTYTIEVSNVSDLNKNKMTFDSYSFSYYKVKPYDIIINEVMADPDPSIKLPNEEYIELYNKTNYPISLKEWALSFGSYSKTLADFEILPHQYLIITDEEKVSLFKQYGSVIGISGLSITNAGQAITLRNKQGIVISHVLFDDSWYQDNYKAQGGWSLEQINMENACCGKENWRASKSNDGGTPGKQNSVSVESLYVEQSSINKVCVIDELTIQLYFNKMMDSISLTNSASCQVSNGVGNPKNIYPVGPDFQSAIIEFNHPLNTGTTYTISVVDSLADCVGNKTLLWSSVDVAIPENIEENEIVINEILFNPKEDGVDFVELYNRSEKVFDMKDLILCSMDTITSALEDIINIDNCFLLFPGQYVVLTTDPDKVKEQYVTSNPRNFIIMSNFPSYNNEEGTVVVALRSGEIIDKFHYSEKMHYPLLSSAEGVSLERISVESQTDDARNWHSAAETVGFATPAYCNSQSASYLTSESIVTVFPEIFSPDNDGYHDVLIINYRLEESGYMANIMIFNDKGKFVKLLTNNELLGLQGQFIWDGIDDNGVLSPVGIYIAYVELYDLKGHLKRDKKVFVIGAEI